MKFVIYFEKQSVDVFAWVKETSVISKHDNVNNRKKRPSIDLWGIPNFIIKNSKFVFSLLYFWIYCFLLLK